MAKRKRTVRKPSQEAEREAAKATFPKIPYWLRVGPVLYDVRILPEDEWRWPKMVGWLSSDKRQVRILGSQSPADVVWTFLHEVFHAAWRDRTQGNAWEALIRNADRSVLVEELEEAAVDSICPAIMDMFINNPWLLEMMAAYVKHLKTYPEGGKVVKRNAR